MRVLVISDIHANLVALETVLNAASGEYDLLWCLGDVVGYGPKPNECVDIVREKATLCVIGNHDWAALDRPGINVDDVNPHARHAVLWTKEQLTASSRTFLDALPDQPVHPSPHVSLIATHARPREPVWEYILTPSIALENFASFPEHYCLVGHTHKPAIFAWRLQRVNDDETVSAEAERAQQNVPTSGSKGTAAPSSIATVHLYQPTPEVTINLRATPKQRLILNPGSVGQPRDNDARAAYAILDTEKGTWRQERTPYPIELTQNQMRAAKLPRRLIDRLSFGW